MIRYYTILYYTSLYNGREYVTHVVHLIHNVFRSKNIYLYLFSNVFIIKTL